MSGDSSNFSNVVTFKLGTFNMGICQDILTGNNCRKWMKQAERVINKAFDVHDLSIFCACEVGGHKEKALRLLASLSTTFLMTTAFPKTFK